MRLHNHENRIQGLSDEINDQIKFLDGSLDQVLEKHEKDFLSAYRVRLVPAYFLVPYDKSLKRINFVKTKSQRLRTQNTIRNENICFGVDKQHTEIRMCGSSQEV